eukprot:scaffold1190_cov393-Prasinococcus_capsulatus_cf.AAC.40
MPGRRSGLSAASGCPALLLSYCGLLGTMHTTQMLDNLRFNNVESVRQAPNSAALKPQAIACHVASDVDPVILGFAVLEKLKALARMRLDRLLNVDAHGLLGAVSGSRREVSTTSLRAGVVITVDASHTQRERPQTALTDGVQNEVHDELDDIQWQKPNDVPDLQDKAPIRSECCLQGGSMTT